MNEAHVYIYGVIDFWQDDHASEWGMVNLKDVKNQVENQKDAERIIVHIHSEGGVVTEGFAIHDYLRSLGKPIDVIIEGMCASIATVIALAGDTRKMTSNATFFIHNPWGFAGGNADEIEKYSEQLRKMEGQISDFYSKKTKITQDQALEWMKEEKYFTPEEALEYGFITEIATVMRAVALFNKDSFKTKTMSKSKDSKKGKTFAERLAAFGRTLDELVNPKPLNIVVQDVNGVEITFPDVADGETPAVGDTATVDGSPAEGEYQMPEGETYVFSGGTLNEIKEDNADETMTLEEALAEIDRLKGELAAAQDSLSAANEDNEELRSQNVGHINSLNTLKKEFNELKNLAGELDIDIEPDADDAARNAGGKKPKTNGARPLFKAGRETA